MYMVVFFITLIYLELGDISLHCYRSSAACVTVETCRRQIGHVETDETGLIGFSVSFLFLFYKALRHEYKKETGNRKANNYINLQVLILFDDHLCKKTIGV